LAKPPGFEVGKFLGADRRDCFAQEQDMQVETPQRTEAGKPLAQFPHVRRLVSEVPQIFRSFGEGREEEYLQRA
jgi:hypothetical protein